MKSYPDPILHLIEQLSVLPGVGFRTAERYVYHLLKQNPDTVTRLGNALIELPKKLRYCSRCYDYSDAELCSICANPGRDKTTLCVIGQPYDIPAIEQTGYVGVYFVLGGELQPLSGIGPEQLRIRECMRELETNPYQEIILAFNPDKDGEATAVFLAGALKKVFKHIKITRIAKGIPLGSAIEYADEVSLSAAMENRKEI